MEAQDSAGKGSTDRNDQRRSGTRPWKIAIPFAVIAAAFYSQGRAYYEGYLDHLGISSSQFPLSTTDTYWEALKGWVLLVGKGVPAIWEAYPLYLTTVWKPLLAVVGMLSVLWLADRLGWRERLRTFVRTKQVGAKLKGSHLGLAILAMLAWMLSVPLLLMAAMLVVALFIVALVVPFDSLGHLGAQQYCETAASRVPVAHFAGDDRTSGTADKLSKARLLQCSSDFCALIRDGEAFVIPRQALQRADGVPVIPRTNNQKGSEVKKVVPQDQLCFKPGVAAASQQAHSVTLP
jgi:hypothetical protein